jgi:hypothetical protein
MNKSDKGFKLSTSVAMNVAVISALVSITMAGSVIAGDMSMDNDRMTRAEYSASVKNTKADYKSAMEACSSSSGDERADCRREARSNRDSAMTNARARMGPMASRDPIKHAPNGPDTSNEGVATPRDVRGTDGKSMQRDNGPANAPVGTPANTGEGGKITK